jgi:hypothetical protein
MNFRTYQGSVAVLSSTRDDVHAVGVCDEEIWPGKWFEDTTCCGTVEDSTIYMSLAHVIQVHSIDDRSSGGRSYFPYSSAQRVPRCKWRNGQTLTLS